MDNDNPLTKELMGFLRSHFRLDWQGIHGAPHWARVNENGLRLAKQTHADTEIVQLFSVLHDSCRRDDGRDPEHGQRAAVLAMELNGRYFNLDGDRLTLLMAACAGHSKGSLQGDVTVQTCWDADRLDLGRVGMRPDPARLCTVAGQDPLVIEWAYRRSIRKGP